MYIFFEKKKIFSKFKPLIKVKNKKKYWGKDAQKKLHGAGCR